MKFEEMNKNELLEISRKNPENLGEILSVISEDLAAQLVLENKDLAIRAISISPEWYLEFNTELSRDKDVVTALCENVKSFDDKSEFEGHFRRAISSMKQEEYDNMFADRDFVFTLMDLNGVLFGNASEELRNDRELLLKALETEDECVSLHYASDELRSDREIAERAIGIQMYNYFNISDDLKTDRELVLKVLKLDPHILEFADEFEELLEEDDFLLEALKQNPEIVKYLSYDEDLQARAEEMLKSGILDKKETEVEYDEGFLDSSDKKQVEFFLQKYLSQKETLETELDETQLKIDEMESEIHRTGSSEFEPEYQEIFELYDKIGKLEDALAKAKKSISFYESVMELHKKEAELSALEAEEKTITEAEALIDKQAEKTGEQK